MHTTTSTINMKNEENQDSLKEEIMGMIANTTLPVVALNDSSHVSNDLEIGEKVDSEPAIVLDFVRNNRRYVVLEMAEVPETPVAQNEEVGGEHFSKTDPEEIHLSPREQEIVRLVAKGYPNKTIAGILDISPWTVSTHLRRVFAKLGVNSRAEMVAIALNMQLLPANSA